MLTMDLLNFLLIKFLLFFSVVYHRFEVEEIK